MKDGLNVGLDLTSIVKKNQYIVLELVQGRKVKLEWISNEGDWYRF